MLLMIRIALSDLAPRMADSRSDSVRHGAVHMLEFLHYLPRIASNTAPFLLSILLYTSYASTLREGP